MTLMKMLFVATGILLSGFYLLSTAQAAEDKVITDSLVLNLSCQNLTKDNVLLSLQPDAFSASRHIPIANWNQGALGQCWSLSLTQREIFYLVRFNGPALPARGRQDEIAYFLDLAHGEADFKVQLIDSPSLSEGPILEDLFLGSTGKQFTNNIASRESRHFFRPTNIGLVLGNRDRGQKRNNLTMSAIVNSLAKGRLPLLILRRSRSLQHAVLVKSAVKNDDGTYSMAVYDSNSPSQDNILNFSKGEFYAGNILDIDAPVGVFFADNDGEMDRIQDAVYRYYAQACGIPVKSLLKETQPSDSSDQDSE